MEYRPGPDHTHDKTGVQFFAFIIGETITLKKWTTHIRTRAGHYRCIWNTNWAHTFFGWFEWLSNVSPVQQWAIQEAKGQQTIISNQDLRVAFNPMWAEACPTISRRDMGIMVYYPITSCIYHCWLMNYGQFKINSKCAWCKFPNVVETSIQC